MSQRYKDPAVSQWTWLKPSELWPRGPMVSGPWDNLLHLSPLKLSGASALLTPTSAPRKVGGVVPCPRLPLCSLPCSQQLQRTRPGLGRGWERQEGETESGSSCSSPVLCLARIPRIGSRGTHPSLNVSTQTHSRREIELYFCVDGFVDNEELARTWISDSTAVELGFRVLCPFPSRLFLSLHRSWGSSGKRSHSPPKDWNGEIVTSASGAEVGSAQERSLPGEKAPVMGTRVQGGFVWIVVLGCCRGCLGGRSRCLVVRWETDGAHSWGR